jgi:nucleoid DNA-binding protein
MRKADVLLAIQTATALSPSQAQAVLDAWIEQITNRLARGEPVALAGFGRFSCQTRPARLGRNPQTGATLNLPAQVQPLFKPADAFKRQVQP